MEPHSASGELLQDRLLSDRSDVGIILQPLGPRCDNQTGNDPHAELVLGGFRVPLIIAERVTNNRNVIRTDSGAVGPTRTNP